MRNSESPFQRTGLLVRKANTMETYSSVCDAEQPSGVSRVTPCPLNRRPVQRHSYRRTARPGAQFVRTGHKASRCSVWLRGSRHRQDFLRPVTDKADSHTSIYAQPLNAPHPPGVRNAVQKRLRRFEPQVTIPSGAFNPVALVIVHAAKTAQMAGRADENIIRLMKDETLWRGIKPDRQDMCASGRESRQSSGNGVSRYRGQRS